MEKSCAVCKTNKCKPKTLSWITLDSTLTSLFWQPSTIREKLCQKKQHRTSNFYSTELVKENHKIIDSVQSSTEVDLNNSSFLPCLQSTWKACQTQKGIRSGKTFPTSKLGGGKHTSAFHKPPKPYTRCSNSLDSNNNNFHENKITDTIGKIIKYRWLSEQVG